MCFTVHVTAVSCMIIYLCPRNCYVTLLSIAQICHIYVIQLPHYAAYLIE